VASGWSDDGGTWMLMEGRQGTSEATKFLKKQLLCIGFVCIFNRGKKYEK